MIDNNNDGSIGPQDDAVASTAASQQQCFGFGTRLVLNVGSLQVFQLPTV